MSTTAPFIQPPIVDLFGDAVKAMEPVLLPYLQSVVSTVQQIHYLYGHPRAIVNKLAQMQNPQAFQYLRFPLVALFQDFRETVGGAIGVRSTVRLRCIIAMQTMEKLDTDQRYERTFKPVLYPVYEELLRQLGRCRHFFVQAPTTIQHTKTDRPFWGKDGLYGNSGNVFNDALDCIEITDLLLPVEFASGCFNAPKTNL